MSKTKVVLEDGTEKTFDRVEIEDGFVICWNREYMFDDSPWWLELMYTISMIPMYKDVDKQLFPEHRVQTCHKVS